MSWIRVAWKPFARNSASAVSTIAALVACFFSSRSPMQVPQSACDMNHRVTGMFVSLVGLNNVRTRIGRVEEQESGR